MVEHSRSSCILEIDILQLLLYSTLCITLATEQLDQPPMTTIEIEKFLSRQASILNNLQTRITLLVVKQKDAFLFYNTAILCRTLRFRLLSFDLSLWHLSTMRLTKGK